MDLLGKNKEDFYNALNDMYLQTFNPFHLLMINKDFQSDLAKLANKTKKQAIEIGKNNSRFISQFYKLQYNNIAISSSIGIVDFSIQYGYISMDVGGDFSKENIIKYFEKNSPIKVSSFSSLNITPEEMMAILEVSKLNVIFYDKLVKLYIKYLY